MTDPVGMECCQGKQLCYRENLLKFFQYNKKACPMCGSPSDPSRMIESGQTIRMARLGILDIRKQLKITYERMSPDLK